MNIKLKDLVKKYHNANELNNSENWRTSMMLNSPFLILSKAKVTIQAKLVSWMFN